MEHDEDTTILTVGIETIESERNKDEFVRKIFAQKYKNTIINDIIKNQFEINFEQIFVTINEVAEVNKEFRYC